MSEDFSLSVCWEKAHRCSFFQHALIFECLYPGLSPTPSCTKLFSVQRQGLIHSVPSQMFYSFSESFYDWFSNHIPLGRGESVLWLYPLANIWLYLFLQNISLFIWTGFSYPFKYKRQNTEASFICMPVDLIVGGFSWEVCWLESVGWQPNSHLAACSFLSPTGWERKEE